MYGAAALLGGAASGAINGVATGAPVSTMDQSGPLGKLAGTLTQRLRAATASATGEASSPQANADTRELADTATGDIARASWFSFAALLVGAIISLASGHAGFRHQPPLEEGAELPADNIPLRRDAIPGRSFP